MEQGTRVESKESSGKRKSQLESSEVRQHTLQVPSVRPIKTWSNAVESDPGDDDVSRSKHRRASCPGKAGIVDRAAALRKLKLEMTATRMNAQSQKSGAREEGDYTPAIAESGNRFSNLEILTDLLLEPINLLLVAAPVGLYLSSHDGPPGIVFWTCFIALIPLAKLLGDSTEHLAENLSDTAGGLLNATFGNATEMIITVKSIEKGLLGLVKKSLLGSILSNMLLVLGMALFAGGIVRPGGQSFGNATGLINITMLFVGLMSMSLPTISSFSQSSDKVLKISRASSISIGIGYFAFLVHSLIEGDVGEGEDKEKREVDLLEAELPDIPEAGEDGGGEEKEEKEAVLEVPWAASLLFLSTCLVSVLSEVMVGAIEGFMKDWQFPEDFVGVILLPIVGNACEHASAVRMAYNNKVGAAIAVAVGSSTQITLLVMPFSVIAAWIVGQPLDFNMGLVGLSVQTFSVLAVFSIITDGHSTWIEGFMLVLAYVLVGVIYWYSESDIKVEDL